MSLILVPIQCGPVRCEFCHRLRPIPPVLEQQHDIERDRRWCDEFAEVVEDRKRLPACLAAEVKVKP